MSELYKEYIEFEPFDKCLKILNDMIQESTEAKEYINYLVGEQKSLMGEVFKKYF